MMLLFPSLLYLSITTILSVCLLVCTSDRYGFGLVFPVQVSEIFSLYLILFMSLATPQENIWFRKTETCEQMSASHKHSQTFGISALRAEIYVKCKRFMLQ